MRIIFAIMFGALAVLVFGAGDGAIAIVFGVLALAVLVGFGRFLRLLAGITMILRAMAG